MMDYHYGGWGGWVAMSLMMVVFWGGLIGLVWAVLASRREHHTPEQVLADRFARGEITEDEFVHGRDVLVGVGTSVASREGDEPRA